jgi:hypothetical protein
MINLKKFWKKLFVMIVTTVVINILMCSTFIMFDVKVKEGFIVGFIAFISICFGFIVSFVGIDKEE